MSARFSGTGQQFSATTGLPTGNVWTMLSWIYLSSDRNAYSTFWNLFDVGSNYGEVAASVDGTSVSAWSFSKQVGPFAMTVGVWHRAAMVVNGANCNFYIGPISGSLSTFSDSTFATNTPDTLRIGSNQSNDWLDGRVAGFKLWNAALTQTECEAEFGSRASASRTVDLLRIHGFQTASTADDSGNGNTLSGGTGATTEDDPPYTDPLRVPIKTIQIPT